MCSPALVLCYGCLMPVDKTVEDTKQCSVCKEYICPHCGICGCKLSLESKRVLLAMMATYERVLNHLKKEFELGYGRVSLYHVADVHKELVKQTLSTREKFILERFS